MNDELPEKDVAASVKSGRKWPKRVAWILSGVVALLVFSCIIYMVIVNHRGEKAKEKVLESLIAHGLPTDLSYREGNVEPSEERFWDTETIKEENSNGTRFYLAAFELASFPRGQITDLPYQGYGDTPHLGQRIDTKLAARLDSYITTQQTFYDLIDQGRRCESFSYELDVLRDPLSKRPAITVWRNMRSAARHLQILCLHRQAIGDAQAALDACEAILDMNRSFNDEPWMIAWLIRAATVSMTAESIEEVLSRASPSVESLTALANACDIEANALDFADIAKAEVAILGQLMKNPGFAVARYALGIESHYSGRHDARLVASTNPMDPQPKPSKLKVRYTLALTRLLYTLFPGHVLEGYAKYIESCIQRYEDTKLSPGKFLEKALKTAFQDTGNPYDPYSEAAWARGIVELIQSKARMRVVRTALLVERYRAEHNVWPEQLTDAHHDLLMDPFSGESLRYVSTDSGRLIYSIGKNQKDDGGEWTTGMDGKDDIAFRLFSPEERNTTQPEHAADR